MFAHPATHHFSKTYGGHNAATLTTAKRNLNKENAGALPSKTPSRAAGKALMPGTSLRVGLGVKSSIKDGNVQHGSHGDGKDAKGKGKEEEIGEHAACHSLAHVQLIH